MSVTEYRDRFLQLARYAPADVADDRKKQEHFMEGLEDYLQYALLNLRFDDFNHLVDSALNTERKHLEMEDKKRKIVPVASGSNTRPRLQPPQQYLQQQYRPPQQYQLRPQQYPPRVAGRSGPEVTGTSGSRCFTSSASTAGSTAGRSSCWTAGSSNSSCVLSLRPSGALRQLLPPEGAGGIAGAPSSAQGASTGSGEPRDGRVSGRGS